jgi:hypothetical protein
MRHFLTTVLLIFLIPTIYSQNTHFTIEETTPFKDIKTSSALLGTYHYDNGEITIVRGIKNELIVSHFDASHDLQSNIELGIDKKELFVGSAITGDRVQIFTSKKINKKTIGVYCRTFVPGFKQLKMTQLYTIDTGKKSFWLDLLMSLSGIRKHEENFRISPNGEYIAFAVDQINLKSSTSVIRIFDKNLLEVYNASIQKENQGVFLFDDFIVTNDAEVITTGKVYKKGLKEPQGKKGGYEYMIHKITQDETIHKGIHLEEKFIQELRFAQTDNEIRLLGFYSEKNSFRMKGGISFIFDGSDITKISPKTTPFPASVYDDIYREGKAERRKKKGKEFQNYYLDYSIVDEYGDAYLLAEQFYITERTRSLTTVYSSTYHYDNILIVKFDKEGNLVWGRSILKKSNEPSYNAFALDGKLHVLLNTGKNIQEKSNGRKEVKKKFLEKSALFDIVFDDKGEQTFEMIKENDGRKDFYSPNGGNYDYDTFIMANLSKNKRQFLILTKK